MRQSRRRGFNRQICLVQIGLVTWLMALLAVQLQLTHPAVFKVWNFSLQQTLCRTAGRLKPDGSVDVALQGALSHFWRVAVGVLGVLVFAVVYTEPAGKPAVRQTAGQVQMRGIPSSGGGGGGGDGHEALAKQL